MATITLITGGARSGKSDFAVARARGYARRVFVATALPVDDEMAARIAAHRQARGEEFQTVEAPEDLAVAMRALRDCDVAVVDCLTVWVGNLMHRHGQGEAVHAAVDAFVAAIQQSTCDLLVVTNEVGMGIVPEHALARTYRDVLGRVNARVAGVATKVVLMVAGVPVWVKGKTTDCRPQTTDLKH